MGVEPLQNLSHAELTAALMPGEGCRTPFLINVSRDGGVTVLRRKKGPETSETHRDETSYEEWAREFSLQTRVRASPFCCPGGEKRSTTPQHHTARGRDFFARSDATEPWGGKGRVCKPRVSVTRCRPGTSRRGALVRRYKRPDGLWPTSEIRPESVVARLSSRLRPETATHACVPHR